MNQTSLSAFIWSVADLLRSDYKQSEYGRVILPFTVLRRLNCVLEFTKNAALAELEAKTKIMATKFLLPVHPGEILREEFMRLLELSSHALARALGVTPARLNDIANEKRGITAGTALHLGRYFGTTGDIWVNLQKRFELKKARRKLSKRLDLIRPRAT